MHVANVITKWSRNHARMRVFNTSGASASTAGTHLPQFINFQRFLPWITAGAAGCGLLAMTVMLLISI